jgi:NADH-quinone oxidoreductase subunit E
VCTWREAERVLAGFPDGLADEGPAAGHASLVGLEIARQNGWTAPRPEVEEVAQQPSRNLDSPSGAPSSPAGAASSSDSAGAPTSAASGEGAGQ